MPTFAFNSATLGAKTKGDHESLFPPNEAASFASRPTPVVPASADLLGKADGGSPWTDVTVAMALEADVTVTMESGPAPSLPPELLASQAPPSEAPVSAPVPSSRESFEHHFYNSAPSVAPVSLPPALDLPPPRRSRARSVVAKALFLLLFGGVIILLGYALREKLSQGGASAGSLVSASAFDPSAR